uniref:mannan endo-1,6-alpha-mannosidase n=1 Tax=uncultured Aspergillus TaxID=246267 RepID=A0A060BWV9_9EURO|nr:Glyco_hydro_76 [uncultured Aspergillus]
MATRRAKYPGKLPENWWQSAILFDTMIRYWHFTGDASNNAAVSQGMYHQAGDDSDYMSSDARAHISNVDQAYWGLAAITAAELDFPAESKQPAWANSAQNVFDELVYRWDEGACKGGLRWQIWPYRRGLHEEDGLG